MTLLNVPGAVVVPSLAPVDCVMGVRLLTLGFSYVATYQGRRYKRP